MTEAEERLKTALACVKMSRKGEEFARALFKFLGETYGKVAVFWDEGEEHVEFITLNGSVQVYDTTLSLSELAP